VNKGSLTAVCPTLNVIRCSTAKCCQRLLPGGAELALVGFATMADDSHTDPLTTHVANALARYVAAYRPYAAMATTARAVYVMLPGEAMSTYDHEHHTHYAASMTAWLGAVGDIASASAVLGVHPNTLRYRLRRAGELFDISLDHPDDRLSVWMQLRLC
jgi:PucR C-terminal helix-turn-helix domain